MIKNLIKKVYLYIKRIYVRKKLRVILERKKEKCIFLIGSPLHGNIGDHAISIAERKLLENIDEKQIIEIPGEYYNLGYDKIKNKVKKEDIIIITGGGFIGSLWLNEENMVRHIISHFMENRIIIMPQTIFFEKNELGKKELNISKAIYESHPDLWIFVREEKSFNFCKENFNKIENVFLVPDIVMYLDYQLPQDKREGVLFCIRKDKEKVLDTNKINDLTNIIKSINLQIKETTTVLKKRISLKQRQYIFENKLLEFKKSRLVITDRLHGMIFAAITATPCIAMDNLSGKVRGVYEWLKNIEYIKFIENTDNIIEEVKEIMEKEDCEYNAEVFQKKFDKILNLIND